MKSTILLKTAHSRLILYKNYHHLDPDDVEQLELEERPPIFIFGKMCRQNRNVGFFSDESVGYHYSRQRADSKPMPEWMVDLMKKINLDLETDFNGVLVNQYENGSQCIGSHSDDEKTLSVGPHGLTVASLSLGATRIFRVRAKYPIDVIARSSVISGDGKETMKGGYYWRAEKGTIVANVPHKAGDLLLMVGDFQKEFKHEIPAESDVEDARWSLTFRSHSV